MSKEGTAKALGAAAKAQAATPHGGNLFATSIIGLDHAFFVGMPTAGRILLYVLAGLYAIGIICLLTGFFARWRRGAFWLVRLKTTPSGTFIRPNATVLHSFFAFIFIVLAEAYIWKSLQALDVGANLDRIIAWKGLIWTPLWLSGWAETTGVASQYLTSSRGQLGVRKSRIPAWAFNTVALVMPAVLVGLQMGLFSLASIKFDQMYSVYLQTRAILVQYEPSWTPAGAATVQGMALSQELLHLTAVIYDRQTPFLRWFSAGWISLAVCTGIMYSIYVPFVLVHVRDLKRQIVHLTASERVAAQLPSSGHILSKPYPAVEMDRTHNSQNSQTSFGSDEKTLSSDKSHASKPSYSSSVTPYELARVSLQQEAPHALARVPSRFQRALGSHDDGLSSAERHIRALRRACRLRLYSVVVITIVVALYAVLVIWLAVDPAQVIMDESSFTVNTVASLMIYCILGLIMQIFFVRASFVDKRAVESCNAENEVAHLDIGHAFASAPMRTTTSVLSAPSLSRQGRRAVSLADAVHVHVLQVQNVSEAVNEAHELHRPAFISRSTDSFQSCETTGRAL
ncbi:uncharacterized protein L969DRAFT_90603 [Mixia osmundae IAM 14324]|nr:uncharacterized protein L969DRAFT_90603 [Mixia osmundae IAM 14324]KEI36628.1 hypothetical protein L969DRAFT_90603 [Mixia osmundae IAM 14324]